MTSAIVSDLPACPVPAVAAPEAVPSAQAADAGALAAEFASLLLALLPSATLPAQRPGTASAPASQTAAQSKTVQSKEDKAEDKTGDKTGDKEAEHSAEASAQPDSVAAAVIPVAVTPALPLPATLQLATGDSVKAETSPELAEASDTSRQLEAGTRAKSVTAETGGSKTVVTAPAMLPDRASFVAEPAAPAALPPPAGFVVEPAAPAALPLPAGFVIEPPAPAAIPDPLRAASGAPAASPERGTEASRGAAGSSERISGVPQPGTRFPAPEAELAFTARLTAEPAANTPPVQRAPELHLAMPHEVRAPAVAASPVSGKDTVVLEKASSGAPAAGAGMPAAESAMKVAEPPAAPPAAAAAAPAAIRPGGSGAAGEGGRSTAAAPLNVARAGSNPRPAEERNASGGGREPEPERPSPARVTGQKGDPRLEDFGPRQSSPLGEGIRTVQTPQGSEARLPAAGAPAAAGSSAAPWTGRAQELAAALDRAAPAGAAPGESKGPAVRELSVVVPGRISASGEAAPQVQVRVVERTGEVQVAVRSGDERLNNTLREGLG
ncbi:MAG TPA: hypothetical protein VF767_01360, partial [Bryobacteraceae bacterium]